MSEQSGSSQDVRSTRFKRLKLDLVINMATALVNVLALFAAIRLASLTFSLSVLGVVLLARRLGNSAASLYQLGMSQTVQRYVSIHVNDTSVKARFVFLSLVLWLIGALPLAIGLFLFRSDLAPWIFKGADFSESFTLWLGVTVYATVVNFLATSVLLAERRMVAMGFVSVMNASGFFLAAVLWSGSDEDAVSVLSIPAVSILFLSTGVLLAYLVQLKPSLNDIVKHWRSTLWTFLRYGAPRALVAFLDTAILLVGPWLLRSDPAQNAYLMLALQLMRLPQVALTPASKLAAVVAARLMGSNNEDAVREGIWLICGTVLYSTVLAICIFVPWTRVILSLWLDNPEYVDNVSRLFLLLAWGILPLSMFYGLKGIIETRWVIPFNLYTLLAALGTQGSVFFLLKPHLPLVDTVLWSILAMFFATGIFSAFWLRHFLPPARYLGLLPFGIAATAIAGFNFFMAHLAVWFGVVLALLFTGTALLGFMRFFPSEYTKDLRLFILGSAKHQ